MERGWSDSDARICAECVTDYALKEAVRAKEVPDDGPCSSCDRERSAPFDALSEAFVDGLNFLYDDALNSVSPKPRQPVMSTEVVANRWPDENPEILYIGNAPSGPRGGNSVTGWRTECWSFRSLGLAAGRTILADVLFGASQTEAACWSAGNHFPRARPQILRVS